MQCHRIKIAQKLGIYNSFKNDSSNVSADRLSLALDCATYFSTHLSAVVHPPNFADF